MAEFRTFKNKMTGRVVTLPAHYGALFDATLEEVDPSQHHCVDCGVPEEDESVEAAPEAEHIAIEEPEPLDPIRLTRFRD